MSTLNLHDPLLLCERSEAYMELVKNAKPFENQSEWKAMVKSLVKPIPASAWTIQIQDPNFIEAGTDKGIVLQIPYVYTVDSTDAAYDRAMGIIK